MGHLSNLLLNVRAGWGWKNAKASIMKNRTSFTVTLGELSEIPGTPYTERRRQGIWGRFPISKHIYNFITQISPVKPSASWKKRRRNSTANTAIAAWF
jgi:hypothetical protein